MTSEPNEAKELFKDHLSGKEQILWASRPKQGVQLRTADKYMIPFSLLWCATVVLWEWFTLGMGELGTTMAWLGIPFMLIGLYLLLGRFFMDAFTRRHTFYAISPKKILVKTGKWNISTDIFPLKTILRITLEKKGDGSGTLRCYDAATGIIVQMEMIQEIERVANLIEAARTKTDRNLT